MKRGDRVGYNSRLSAQTQANTNFTHSGAEVSRITTLAAASSYNPPPTHPPSLEQPSVQRLEKVRELLLTADLQAPPALTCIYGLPVLESSLQRRFSHQGPRISQLPQETGMMKDFALKRLLKVLNFYTVPQNYIIDKCPIFLNFSQHEWLCYPMLIF